MFTFHSRLDKIQTELRSVFAKPVPIEGAEATDSSKSDPNQILLFCYMVAASQVCQF